MSYNDEGQLTDRGTVEGAEAIRTLLTDEWGYTIVEGDLDPNDPLVDTATEYMFQMATIGYHILHGIQTVVLDADVEYEGVLYEAGTHEFVVDGRYWTDFDRGHPLAGPAREQAWSGTAHGLFAELGVGTVTHSTLQIGLSIAGILGAIGLVTGAAGFGLMWAGKERFPDTIPEEMIRDHLPEPSQVG